jgi:hypothetical protein
MAKEKAITSDQMYKIEENGHNLLGMRRVYMMEMQVMDLQIS